MPIMGVLIAGMVMAQSASEPKVWALNDCIQYAKEQNISIQQSRLSQQEADISYRQAKASYWPSLSFSTGHNYTNTPFGEATNNAYSGNAGLNLGWQIYNGSRSGNIKQQKISGQSAALQVSTIENSVVEQIMSAYVHALYAKEAILVNEAMCSSSEALRQQGEARMQVGKMSQSDYAQLKSQCSSDAYNLVSAQATWSNYMLQLKQLMELQATYDLVLAENNSSDEAVMEPIPDIETVYMAALAARPEIKAAELQVQSAEVEMDIAKSGYYPSLSFSAGTGTSYRTGSNFTFGEQMKNNWSNTAGITLSVPIVQNRQNRSAVERAQIQRSVAELSQQEEQKDLRKTIESLWLDARSAQQQFIAAKNKMEATQASYNLVEEQFNVGYKTATEMLTERANMLSATQTYIQAKYMAIYSINMLKFYQGNQISM